MPLPARISRTVPRARKEPREGNSKAHLADIRSLPCVVTGERPVEAHHLLRTGDPNARGMGMKAADRWAIPLTPAMHRAAHAAGDDEQWLAERGIDGRSLAQALWAARGDRDAQERIVFRAWQARGMQG